MTFDRIVVLNLRKRPDRLLQFREDFSFWPFAVFEAIEGKWGHLPEGWDAGPGAWGCCQSHCAVLKQALADGVQHLLVLEDDAVPVLDFQEKLQVFLSSVPEHDGLLLGGQHVISPKRATSAVVQCRNTHRTHAYSVKPDYMQALYQLWSSPQQKTHIDHTWGKLQQQYRVFSHDPFLIGQRGSRSDISGQTPGTQFWTRPTGKEPIFLGEEGKKKEDRRQPLYDFLYYAVQEAINEQRPCVISGVSREEIKKVWQGRVEDVLSLR